jgi:hypothetical protein
VLDHVVIDRDHLHVVIKHAGPPGSVTPDTEIVRF